MSRISSIVAHILTHVEAEAASSDSSQAPGVARRAQKVRDLLASFRTDVRDRTRKQFLLELRGTSDIEMRAALNTIQEDDEGQTLRAVLTLWVGQGVTRG